MLEVHQEESPGEPMKPLSEFIEQYFPHEYIQVEGKPETREHRSHCPPCLLQAWLREAETWVDNSRYQSVTFAGQVDADAVLVELLGTTGQEGEK